MQASFTGRQIPRDRLHLGKVLGEGEFGLVTKAELTEDDGQIVPCAVKTIKRKWNSSSLGLRCVLSDSTRHIYWNVEYIHLHTQQLANYMFLLQLRIHRTEKYAAIVFVLRSSGMDVGVKFCLNSLFSFLVLFQPSKCAWSGGSSLEQCSRTTHNTDNAVLVVSELHVLTTVQYSYHLFGTSKWKHIGFQPSYGNVNLTIKMFKK